MLELSPDNALAYLESRGYPADQARVAELGGGVSNTVLLVETRSLRLVLKQALGKLRVEQDWFSDRGRVLREAEAIEALAPHLPPGAVPEIFFIDRHNLIYAMSAASAGARTWKALLLDGVAERSTAATVAGYLAAMLRASWQSPAWEQRFGDQTVFDQLRIDPYYRSTASRHPDLAPYFGRLMAESAARRVSIVHGDWSPKNFLLSGSTVTAIDFEVIHFGDPAFDSGFLLNHLLLKSFHRPQFAPLYRELAHTFWDTLTSRLPAGAGWFEAATIRHLGCLHLARIDGKSPAEYIRDEAVKQRVRTFARRLILDPPSTVSGVFEILCR